MTDLPPDPSGVSNAQLMLMMQQMSNKLDKTNLQLEAASTRISSLEAANKDLLATWNAGRTVLAFFKLAGGIGVGIAAITGLLNWIRG